MDQNSDSENETFEDAVEEVPVEIKLNNTDLAGTICGKNDNLTLNSQVEQSEMKDKIDNDNYGESNKLTSDSIADDLNVLLAQDDSCSDGEETFHEHAEVLDEKNNVVNSSPSKQSHCDNQLYNQENYQDLEESEKEASVDRNTEQDNKAEEEEDEVEVDEDLVKEAEAKLTDDEKEEKKNEAQELKAKGNELFKDQNYDDAKQMYTQAILTCPLCFAKERSIMYSNRGACTFRQEKLKSCIKDCSKALEINPNYMKALLRRAECYEKTEKLDEALADYQKALEMDPSLHTAREACMRLPEQIKDRNEKMKDEMLGKLKELGNMVLKPFGLSTENFQMNQDPNTGSYSVNFNQGKSQQK